MFRFVETLIRSYKPLLFASRRALLKPSATSRKSKVERGHPCRKSLLEWKKWDVAPLMRNAKEVVEIHANIHFIKE